MKNSAIEWCDHTFNPWIGCTKVSPGCANCYAETLMDKRYGKVKWGKGNPRRRTSEDYWEQPLIWNAEAKEIEEFCKQNPIWKGPHQRPTVFCASLADVFDEEIPIEWFSDLLTLIYETQYLTWQLLTKRPKNIRKRLEAALDAPAPSWLGDEAFADEVISWIDDWISGIEVPQNIWLGTSVENQEQADKRIPILLTIPSAVRFLSCEPLLSFVNLADAGYPWATGKFNALTGTYERIDWVIAGGESGPGARPMHPDWARSLRDQCSAANVPFLFKQWGEYLPRDHAGMSPHGTYGSENSDFVKVGKKASGRLLDGREWNEFPKQRFLDLTHKTS